MDTMGERLKWAREKAGYKSARSAALTKLRISPSTYAAHENRQNDFNDEDAIRYGRAFNVNPGWLLTGDGESGRRKTLLEGKVGAGAKVTPVDAGSDEIDLPPGAPPNAKAVEVVGDSMYPRYFGGEKLFYIPNDSHPRDQLGKECVLKLANGDMLVKVLRAGSNRRVFNLEGLNSPMLLDQKILWAAPVKWTER